VQDAEAFKQPEGQGHHAQEIDDLLERRGDWDVSLNEPENETENHEQEDGLDEKRHGQYL
jgi:hypothetical protein